MNTRFGQLLIIAVYGLGATTTLAIRVRAKSATAVPGANTRNPERNKVVQPEIDQDLIDGVIAERRKQLSPLFEQERVRLAAVSIDRRMNSAAKKDAAQKIEKEYRDKRNAIRLKMRMELRSRLLGENAR